MGVSSRHSLSMEVWSSCSCDCGKNESNNNENKLVGIEKVDCPNPTKVQL